MEPVELLSFAARAFESLNIPYATVGSMASSFYGEARMTADVDIVADVKTEHIPHLLRAFPKSDFYLSDIAIIDALKHRTQFNILHPDSGLKIDVMIPDQHEHIAIELRRRTRVRSPDGSLDAYMAAPEDVILKKMAYFQEGGSQKHIRDITGMLKISGDRIDRAYIAEWAKRMGVEDVWQDIISRVG